MLYTSKMGVIQLTIFLHLYSYINSLGPTQSSLHRLSNSWRLSDSAICLDFVEQIHRIGFKKPSLDPNSSSTWPSWAIPQPASFYRRMRWRLTMRRRKDFWSEKWIWCYSEDVDSLNGERSSTDKRLIDLLVSPQLQYLLPPTMPCL